MELSDKELAQELFDNYEEITGVAKEDVINKRTGWDEPVLDFEVVVDTIGDLDVYTREKYGVNLRRRDKALTELDRLFIHSM